MGNQLKILNEINEGDQIELGDKTPIEIILQLNREILSLFGTFITEDGKTIDYEGM
jgi:hypothetical protein